MHYSSLCNTNISSPLSKNEKIIPKRSKKSVYAAVSFELREGVPLLQVSIPISAADAILGAARDEPPVRSYENSQMENEIWFSCLLVLPY